MRALRRVFLGDNLAVVMSGGGREELRVSEIGGFGVIESSRPLIALCVALHSFRGFFGHSCALPSSPFFCA